MVARITPALLLLALPLAACGGDAPRNADAAPPADAVEATQASPAASGEGAAQEVIYASGQEAPSVTVWKSPSCGCCSKWIEHLEAAGFQVDARDVQSLVAVKQEHGIASEHQSCHTALVEGYVVEGHVPADVVARMLEEEPDIRGVAVPGMPIGSPGMEVGDQKQPYDVLALTHDGQAVVYESR